MKGRARNVNQLNCYPLAPALERTALCLSARRLGESGTRARAASLDVASGHWFAVHDRDPCLLSRAGRRILVPWSTTILYNTNDLPSLIAPSLLPPSSRQVPRVPGQSRLRALNVERGSEMKPAPKQDQRVPPPASPRTHLVLLSNAHRRRTERNHPPGKRARTPELHLLPASLLLLPQRHVRVALRLPLRPLRPSEPSSSSKRARSRRRLSECAKPCRRCSRRSREASSTER